MTTPAPDDIEQRCWDRSRVVSSERAKGWDLGRRSALERAASWHDAEAARLDEIAGLGGVRPPTAHSFRTAALADEHRRSAATIRAMKGQAP